MLCRASVLKQAVARDMVNRFGAAVPVGPFCFWADQGAQRSVVAQRESDFDRIAARTEAGGLDVDDDRRLAGEVRRGAQRRSSIRASR